ncbi:two pore domain potassium channel family protein [Spongiibacter sp. KMU-158]|uniref:Two pore domain potassium channel family protein n=1 Tax=Spongiibacter pelagi TaxID=2760804 RepID=A0A927C288_9GAMM|nr:potassium channel family protein [Spongiibacter pelagi]MBD2858697.1 two pore domain potassium channel family protein [Spongiibacter pelagi]
MLLVFAVNSLVCLAVVLIHHEMLIVLQRRAPHLRSPRHRVLFALVGTLLAHVAEIWVFGLVYYTCHYSTGLGGLAGNFDGSLLDSVYFSFSAYTTLGFGDIYPSGNLRFLSGLEALLGLVLIAWTASFLYIEMRQNWDKS